MHKSAYSKQQIFTELKIVTFKMKEDQFELVSKNGILLYFLINYR